jgi:hypothetical protein
MMKENFCSQKKKTDSGNSHDDELIMVNVSKNVSSERF